MSHTPIIISNISYHISHKALIKNFTATISPGSKIGIIGRNGSGKSTLLHLLNNDLQPTHGTIHNNKNINIGYVPQIITDFDSHSGGQRFQLALSKALSLQPDLLLLDEPTNHLDTQNRTSLMRMLSAFHGTLLIVTHDPEILRNCVTTLWSFEHDSIAITHSSYDEYCIKRTHIKNKLLQQLNTLNKEKQQAHTALMKEQQRAKNKKARGEKRYAGDTISLRHAQETGQKTAAKNKQSITQNKKEIIAKINALSLPETITPTFILPTTQSTKQTVINIQDGSISYNEHLIISNISFNLYKNERVALSGSNGAGKSTFIRALMSSNLITRTGTWHTPSADHIGYLDQHYSTLNPQYTVLETIQTILPSIPQNQLRIHLNTFLFRTNEEVYTPVAHLSGGEKARLSLACIAARIPQLLILDEITNNIDLETREHCMEILKEYPGTLIIISHDQDFINAITVNTQYEIRNKNLQLL